MMYWFPQSLRENLDNGSNYPCINFKLSNLKDGPEIWMYIPPGFAIGDSVNYNTSNFGASGVALERFGGGGFSKKTVDNINVGEAELVQLGINSAGNLGSTGEAFKKGAMLERGVATNPFSATTFESTGIRTYSFAFKLISESAEESKMAKNIEAAFRKYMLPDSEINSLIVKYPPIWEISFYKGEEKNEYMPKLLESYCTGLTATYNSTSSSFHPDGSPVEVDISITFQETRAVVRSDLYQPDDSLEYTEEKSFNLKSKISSIVKDIL